MNIKGHIFCAAAAMLVCVAPAAAKLPPPSPAEQAAAAERHAAEEARLKQEKEALERVQTEVAERYRREQGAAAPARGGRVDEADMPNNLRQSPPAGPHGGTKQSAEAHSAPAK